MANFTPKTGQSELEKLLYLRLGSSKSIEVVLREVMQSKPCFRMKNLVVVKLKDLTGNLLGWETLEESAV